MTFGRLALLLCAAVLAGCSGGAETLVGLGKAGGYAETAAPVPATEASFAFEPFEGIPVNLADALTQSFVQLGPTYKINVKPRLRDDATHRVRCHILAASMDTEASISFACKVYDRGGRPVHRFAGLLPGGVSLGDPWATSVEGSMSAIAIEILYRLRNWLYAA